MLKEGTDMDTLEILKDLAIIIISAKFFGLAARHYKAPQVAGEIIAVALTESRAMLLLPTARLLLILMASAVDTATGSMNTITLMMLAI